MKDNAKLKIVLFVSIALILPIALCIGATVLLGMSNQSYKDEDVVIENINSQNVTITVDNLQEDDSGSLRSYNIDFSEGQNLFDLLVRLETENSEFDFEYQEFDFGVMITSINGIAPDPAKTFWKFQINGLDSAVGVSQYEVKEGDKIKFIVDDVE